MAAAIAAHDWSATPLGPRTAWPAALATTVDLMLGSHFAMFIAWGPDRIFLCNDACAALLGRGASSPIGQPIRAVWPASWDGIDALVDRVLAGENVAVEDMPLTAPHADPAGDAGAEPEADQWWSLSCTPIRGEDDAPAGLFGTAIDTSRKFLDAQRLADKRARIEWIESRSRALLAATTDAVYQLSADWRELRQFDGSSFRTDGDGTASGWIERHVPEEDRPAVLAAIDEAIRNRSPLVLEHRFFRHDGTIGWTSSRAVPIFDADGAIVEWFGTATDISESRAARDALAASREKLELATRAARMGMFDYWPQTGHLEWDERCRAMFGLGPDAPINYEETFLTGLHPDDRDHADAAVRAALDPDGPRMFDMEYRTIGIEDGVERHVHAQGIAMFDGDRAVRLIGAVQDVTQGRRSRLALRETEERLRLAGRATNDAIWDWDFRTQTVTWNIALQHAYGHDLESLDSSPDWWIAQIHPDDRDRVSQSIHGVIDGDGVDWAEEYRFRRADGSYADIFDRGYVLRDPSGQALRMVGAMLDVSARKAVERQLAEERRVLLEEVAATTAERDRAEDALRQSQKMEAVGQLTGGLAHDFNNLLTGISGALEMMQVRISQGRVTELEKYSVAAQGAVRRAAALTHRLLAFSRRQTLDPKPVAVNQLIFDIEELIRRTVGPQIEVETVGKAGVWTTLVDPNQLENAILNLCINARDAMPDGGRITIETANKWLDDRAGRERDLDPGQYVSICVTDTGTGMSPEVAARAFEPFFTTKPMGEGTGLGLSMIYGFARQSGGQVRIYTEPGIGTTMCIYLPRYIASGEEDLAGEIGEDASLDGLRAGGSGCILVIDDEPTVRMLVVEVAEELGYQVIEGFDGASAMRAIQANPGIDLLITDVGLPGGMNGRQIADAALVLRPQLKVLFITGYAENAVVGNGQLEPNMSLITKPFAMEALARRIREIMA